MTKHRTPWVMVGGDLPAFDDDVCELYDGNSDYSQARNLAADQPEMLAKLQRLWLIEATKIAQGGRFGGWCVYAKGGKAKFVYNVLGLQEFATEADTPIPEETHQVRVEFAYDGAGLAKGGDVTLYYDGNGVGKGRVGATQPMVFSADETTDIGYKSATTVSADYTARGSRFTGKIHWVQIDLGDDDHDHFIDPDERLCIAMSRQ